MNKHLNIEYWPAVQASQIASASAFSDDMIDCIYQHDDSRDAYDASVISDCIAIWRTIAVPFAVNHLVLQVDDQVYAVSGHGSLAFHGRRYINLGLLFRSLGDFPFAAPTASVEEPDSLDNGNLFIWRVLERIARCETPRQLRFEIGQNEIVCSADASGVQIMAGAADFEEFVDVLRAGAKSGQQLRYKLSDGQPPPQPSTIADIIGALVGQKGNDEDNWSAKRGCWPAAMPPGAHLDQLRAVMQLASSAAARNLGGVGVSFKGYNADRTLQCEGKIDTEGSVTLRSLL
ncbi:hypothetical protein RCCS2_13959 [Roseobacter sp. CCS2]|nr:hypothetical protein RCCS2_13959 [Roseobacter sp. CCS2]